MNAGASTAGEVFGEPRSRPSNVESIPKAMVIFHSYRMVRQHDKCCGFGHLASDLLHLLQILQGSEASGTRPQEGLPLHCTSPTIPIDLWLRKSANSIVFLFTLSKLAFSFAGLRLAHPHYQRLQCLPSRKLGHSHFYYILSPYCSFLRSIGRTQDLRQR